MSSDTNQSNSAIPNKGSKTNFLNSQNILGIESFSQINITSTIPNSAQSTNANPSKDSHANTTITKDQEEIEETQSSIIIPQPTNVVNKSNPEKTKQKTGIANIADVGYIPKENEDASELTLTIPTELKSQINTDQNDVVSINSAPESSDTHPTEERNENSKSKQRESSFTVNSRPTSSEPMSIADIQPPNGIILQEPFANNDKDTDTLKMKQSDMPLKIPSIDMITKIDENFQTMNRRCRTIEEELLKSNTTISESLNSISELMQKFFKNQEILKMELATIKKSQLKIDVKNVKHISNKIRRERLIGYEDDVEYEIISRNLLRERPTSSSRTEDDHKRRKLSPNEQRRKNKSKQVKPEKPVKPVKPTKMQRIADEVFQKSHPEIAEPLDSNKQHVESTEQTKIKVNPISPIIINNGSTNIPTTAPNAISNMTYNSGPDKNSVIYQHDPSALNFRRTNDLYSNPASSLVNLSASPEFSKQLSSVTKKSTNHIIEMNRPARILGAPHTLGATSTSQVIPIPASNPQSKIKQEETPLSLPNPATVRDIPDNYDNMHNDTMVDTEYDIPESNNDVQDSRVETNPIKESTGQPELQSEPEPEVGLELEPEPESVEEIRKPKVKNFKLTLAGKQKRTIQLYVVDDVLYTGDSPYSAISLVYFVDLKYSEIRRTRETTSINYTFGFPHMLIDEGDKAMEILGMNLMTPEYLQSVEYFLGDFLQACHLVDDKLNPGCTTDIWRRYRNLFLLLMNWRQLAREKRGFRRYTILHAVKEMENFRLHVNPRDSATTEPYGLNKINQRKICESGAVRGWMYQVETTLPVIGQNGINESNINNALDALLKPPPNNPAFVPYALVKAPQGVEVV